MATYFGDQGMRAHLVPTSRALGSIASVRYSVRSVLARCTCRRAPPCFWSIGAPPPPLWGDHRAAPKATWSS
eukprot:6695840-Alexandrium_andersonii.AAC.1